MKNENRTLENVSLKEWKMTAPSVFRQEQMRFERVREAYAAKEIFIKKLLTSKGIHSFDYDLFLRAFKKGRLLEVWVKEKSHSKFRLLTTYDFCKNSGQLGPKRKEGDRQIPEGFYHLSHFNPKSTFLLSLKVNYPNAADKILSDAVQPGSDIYVHGGCQTTGCIPISNDKIQELYLLCVEAFEVGEEIPIHIFPTKHFQEILEEGGEHFLFWKNLEEGFDFFEQNRKMPLVKVSDEGVFLF